MAVSKLTDKIVNFICVVIPEFFKQNIEIKATKRSKFLGAVIGGASLLGVILSVNQFTSQVFHSKWILLAFALFCPFLLAFFTAYRIDIKNEKYNRIWHMASVFLMPFVTITMTECLNGIFIYDMTYLGFFANYIVVLIGEFLIYSLSGSFKWSYIILNPILYGFALAHSYVMDFRGTPFIPMDFFSLKTAAGVANTYDYTPTYKVVIASLILVFILIVSIKDKTPKYQILVKIVARSFAGTFASVVLLLYFGTSVLTDLGVHPDFWNQARGYKNYGFAFNFLSNVRYMYMSEPDDYSPENVKDYVGEVKPNNPKDENIDNSYKKPNIICIMNESLSDLKVLGELETNRDYMPFMRKLKKNTIKGNLYVPVIGAGTSNTEFEFLTGHTTAFLPSGSNAYMLYMDKPIASLVSTVKAQGYSTYAMHPYYAIGWNRTEVYRNFGFNEFISLEDIVDMDIMNKYQQSGNNVELLQQLAEEKYPGENMFIRQYISDEYNYKVLIEDFENRDKSVPYFAFNVTMQNHGGYTTSSSNFDESIYVTSSEEKYIKADKYLSLIKASDDAFKELIKYFSVVEEPTVICMFGDHQPSVENEFIAEILGVKNLVGLTAEQEQNRHCTPFYIWANFDIEEKTIDKMSSNYLSSLVLQTAGIKLTEYNKYLLNLYETLPVIDTVGYIDNEGNYYKWSDSSPYTNLLHDYERVQYNNIFDQKNVNSEIFYLDGYVHEATPEEPSETSQTEE